MGTGMAIDNEYTHYFPRLDETIMWCNTHQRKATYIVRYKQRASIIESHCDPSLGGIMLPCRCVDITNILEVEE